MASWIYVRDFVVQQSYFMLLADENQYWWYLQRFTVEEVAGPRRNGFLIKFYFNENPVFRNRVLSKEYIVIASGGFFVKGVASTTLKWQQGRQPPEYGLAQQSFINWFRDGATSEMDQMLGILDYYLPQMIEAERRLFDNAADDLDLSIITVDEEDEVNDSGIMLEEAYEIDSDS
ncbi:protein SET-like [Toxorhynchites rutilus septentrionalis]|uniref:protein SET-like n=1 Tax=Toxorhynchites rutilus septentrionalis TaxID=329112 RepID=UPI002478F8AF|nr:protein SET-like [Toxorhynchites rutilus septentrionalis]